MSPVLAFLLRDQFDRIAATNAYRLSSLRSKGLTATMALPWSNVIQHTLLRCQKRCALFESKSGDFQAAIAGRRGNKGEWRSSFQGMGASTQQGYSCPGGRARRTCGHRPSPRSGKRWVLFRCMLRSRCWNYLSIPARWRYDALSRSGFALPTRRTSWFVASHRSRCLRLDGSELAWSGARSSSNLRDAHRHVYAGGKLAKRQPGTC